MTEHAADESPPTLPKADAGRFWRRTLLIVGLLVLVWAAGSAHWLVPPLLRADLHADDACWNIFWTYRYVDPQLFPNDPMADFMSSPICARPAYRAVYAVAAGAGLDPLRFSNTLALFLGAINIYLAYLLGKEAGRGSWQAGVGAAIFSVLIPSMFHRVQGGFPRSFGEPIVILALLGILRNRLAIVGVAAVLSAMFYPPSLITPLICAGLVTAWRIWRERTLPPQFWIGSILIAIGVGLLALSYLTPMPPEFGPTTSRDVARAMPEFGPEGRSAFWVSGWENYWILTPGPGLGVKPAYLYRFLILMAVSAYFIRRLVRVELLWLVIASLIGFAIAHVVLFRLHLPNRYISYTLPLFAMMWIAIVIARLQQASCKLACVAITGALVWVGFHAVGAMKEELHKPVQEDLEEAYAFIRTLPKETIVAAHPFDADEIPLRAQRSVPANMETSQAFWLGFYNHLKPRIEAELAACYAVDWADVDAMRQYGASVFLVNNRRLSSERSQQYFAPFREANLKRVAIGQAKGFALAKIPPERVLFHSGDITLVRLIEMPTVGK